MNVQQPAPATQALGSSKTMSGPHSSSTGWCGTVPLARISTRRHAEESITSPTCMPPR